MNARNLIEGEFSDHMAKIKAIEGSPTPQNTPRRHAWSPEKVALQRKRAAARFGAQHAGSTRMQGGAKMVLTPSGVWTRAPDSP